MKQTRLHAVDCLEARQTNVWACGRVRSLSFQNCQYQLKMEMLRQSCDISRIWLWLSQKEKKKKKNETRIKRRLQHAGLVYAFQKYQDQSKKVKIPLVLWHFQNLVAMVGEREVVVVTSSLEQPMNAYEKLKRWRLNKEDANLWHQLGYIIIIVFWFQATPTTPTSSLCARTLIVALQNVRFVVTPRAFHRHSGKEGFN